jgi:predicted MPP superfamily phosphohydrolase
MLDVTILVAAISWIIKGFVGGFSKPIKRSVEVKIKNLSSPITITQITDVHIGKVLGIDFMRDVVNAANELNSDIVVITGDLVDLPPKLAKKKLEPLRDLTSRFGVYFILGNHEYFNGNTQETIELIKTLGIKVLENENVEIDGKINLAGIYDLRGERQGSFKPDISKALKNRNKTLPTVLLSHQPKAIAKISSNDNVDLMISGHTHGGQIFPFGLFVLIDQPYLYGLYKHDEKTQVFVSSGAGYWGPPVRIMAPSEVVKLELKPFIG